ncbi:hypothetical protein [Flavobacterium soyae]|uniref:Uncharacterized protein n=1 Tax=Flavobacterium soyae TaxID=2903098 RepID=A0ABZ2UDE6_9FLAO
MSRKVDFVNDYIANYVSDNFPELSRFKIEMNEDALYFHNIVDGYKHVLYVGLGHITYPDEKVVHGGFHCWTEVTIVENLLIELLSKHKLYVKQLFPTIYFDEFTNTDFKGVWDSFKQFDNYDLSTNKEILDKLCKHYSNVIKQYFIPFWKKYSNIQYINDEIIDKVDQMDLTDYLGVGLVQFKKLIIMRICKNQRYDSYKEWLLNIYRTKEDEMKNDSEWNAKYNLFKELIEILETQY